MGTLDGSEKASSLWWLAIVQAVISVISGLVITLVSIFGKSADEA